MACRGCAGGDGCECSVVGSDDGVITMAGTGAPVTSPYTPTFHGDVWVGDIPTDSTPCSDLASPTIIVRLSDGSLVRVPLPCSEVSANIIPGNAFVFTFSGTTTDADPGNGFLRFNNASYSLTTQLFVSDQEVFGTDITAWLDSLDDAAGSPKGRIRIYSRQDPTDWVDFTLTAVTTATGYRKLVVTYNDHNGTLTNDAADTVLDFSPASDGSVGGFDSIQDIESVTGAYTLDIGDVGKYLRCSNGSPFTVLVPTNASVPFTIGTRIDLSQVGAGQVTIAGDTGVTVNYAPGNKLNGQWAAGTLVKVGTDEWDLFGNLTA